ncbi:hypothetical protein Fcan01_16970 [Folsomia candida]|uniref:Uncharacterized protein n=1 Tax=Folsomia candida TaxID=158441 RepID=A0A226DTQ7_FOLCA|nr:hypothetical protein Fcan01_16970 [Folsomia candida]
MQIQRLFAIIFYITTSLFLYITGKRSLPQINESTVPLGQSPGLELVFEIFSNCTTLIDIGDDQTNFALQINPSILVSSSVKQFNYTGTDRAGIARRKNIIGHCWSFIILFPENDLTRSLSGKSRTHFVTDLILHFIKKPYYVETIRLPQYIVWLTKLAPHFQYLLQATSVDMISLFGSYNFVLVSVRVDLYGELGLVAESGEDLPCLYCYNRYYSNSVKNISLPWLRINCSHAKQFSFFEDLSKFIESISHLNKYFWEVDAWINITSNASNKDTNVIKTIKRTYFTQPVTNVDHLKIAKLTTFNEFLGFWVFQDLLFNIVNTSEKYPQRKVYSIEKMHNLYPLGELSYAPDVYHSIIPIELKFWTFLSCSGVGYHTSPLKQIFTPFQTNVWIGITVIILILISLLVSVQLDVRLVFLMAGILLENSVLIPYEKKISGRKFHTGFKIMLGSYSILFGTVLTNYYKTSFTKEMIIPVKQTAPWQTILDIKNFTFYIPYEALMASEALDGMTSILDYLYFTKLLTRFSTRAQCDDVDETMSLLGGYCRLAASLADSIVFPDFMDTNQTDVFSSFIRPIRYNEVEKLVKGLSTCDKSAYMDSKENVVHAAEFLNDNTHGKVFKKGEDGFMTGMHGWQTTPVQNNFVWDRLNVMISSGIFNYWDAWFKRNKPKKLFQHYANWSHSKIDDVPQLQFNTKISTGFQIYGICIGTTIILGFVEKIIFSIARC